MPEAPLIVATVYSCPLNPHHGSLSRDALRHAPSVLKGSVDDAAFGPVGQKFQLAHEVPHKVIL